MKRRLLNLFVIFTAVLALAVPVYVAPRDDRRDRSAYAGWRRGDFVYEASARFVGWRFAVRLDAPRRESIALSDPRAWNPGTTLHGPGTYPPGSGFDAGFDSYPLGSRMEALGEEPQWLGFGGGAAPTAAGSEHRVYTVWVPVWFLVVVLTLPGARWIAIRRRAFRRMRDVRCTACGYDLRGAWHERCPECGAIALTRPAPATYRPAEAQRRAPDPS